MTEAEHNTHPLNPLKRHLVGTQTLHSLLKSFNTAPAICRPSEQRWRPCWERRATFSQHFSNYFPLFIVCSCTLRPPPLLLSFTLLLAYLFLLSCPHSFLSPLLVLGLHCQTLQLLTSTIPKAGKQFCRILMSVFKVRGTEESPHCHQGHQIPLEMTTTPTKPMSLTRAWALL